MTWNHVRQAIVGLFVSGIALCGVTLVTLQQRGDRFLSVQTGSMVPTFHKGDLVVVNRVPPSSLTIGDVITYSNPLNKKETITHRIVQTAASSNGNILITKGDANATHDAPIRPDAVVGKVTHRVRYLGTAFDFLHSWPGLIVVIYIPVLMIIIAEFKRILDYYREQLPYIMPGYIPGHAVTKTNEHAAWATRLAWRSAAAIVLAMTLMIVGPVFAALQSQVTLTGTSIRTKAPAQPPSTNPCTQTNNTNINFTNNNPQNAQTGDVTQNNNTTPGQGASGDASNNSNTNITVNVTNANNCPTPTT